MIGKLGNSTPAGRGRVRFRIRRTVFPRHHSYHSGHENRSMERLLPSTGVFRNCKPAVFDSRIRPVHSFSILPSSILSTMTPPSDQDDRRPPQSKTPQWGAPAPRRPQLSRTKKPSVKRSRHRCRLPEIPIPPNASCGDSFERSQGREVTHPPKHSRMPSAQPSRKS